MAISQSTLPQFIEKLYGILNDPRYASYIRWGLEGKTFIIMNPAEFSNGVLTEHFKHSNMSSFVRQLNKYDFHKVKSSEAAKAAFGSGVWEFAHRNFQKDRLDLVGLISRKQSGPERQSQRDKSGTDGARHYNAVFYNYVINTMTNITRYFEHISEDLKMMKRLIMEKPVICEKQTIPKALIVEDNAHCAMFASSIFKRNNYATVSAESEKELQYLISNSSFDIILVSNMIPGLVDVIKAIKMANPRSPIILTAEESEKASIFLQKYRGIDEILYKPYAHEELVGMIIKHGEIGTSKARGVNQCKGKIFS